MRPLSCVLIPALLLAAPAAARAQSRRYEVDASRSRVRIAVGKAGLFSFAGHEHEVLATLVEGSVLADAADLPASQVSLTFPAAGLRVSGSGEPLEDVPKVQEKMAGPEVLDVARFPAISFRSTAVKGKPAAGGGYDLELTGELGLHGASRSVGLAVHVQLDEASLTATGRTTLRQTDFGIKPVSVAGVVKVKNDLALDFSIVARRAAE